jgi:uncharacterized membrane-anchored protein YitT (DUF2179 family)
MKSIQEILHPLATGKFWKELVVMTLGMAVGAAAVYYFLMPSNLIIGSISGLAIVISQLTGAEVSLIVTIINAVLLVLAWLLIGAEFGAKTVYTALILGPLLEFWEWLLPYENLMEPGATSVMNDPWFDLLCFVLLLSISQAILFRINASTGGLDILAKIVNKYLHFDIGASVTVAGALICCSAFAINPFRMVVIGLIGTWINGIVVDYFTDTLNKRKKVCIISKDHEIIRQFITGKLKRGCSLYHLIGGFTGEEKIEIVVLLTKHEYADLFKFMKDNEIDGFITAGSVSEIYGNWRSGKVRYELPTHDAKPAKQA